MKRRSHTSRRAILSLYTGAGGLDLGLEAAGFDVILCVELDEDCRATLAKNRPQWLLSDPGDVHELAPVDSLHQAGLYPGELTLLAGGPPCQPFSKSGYWVHGDSSRLSDPRADTLGAYFDYVEAALPQVFLLENVKGLMFNGKDEGLQLLRKHLYRINRKHRVAYEASIVSLNCADFGVPQMRERVFIVAERNGRLFALPKPTHRPEVEILNGESERYRTAWDAIGDLDVDKWPEHLTLRGKWADLIPSIPEGENYLWHTSRSGGDPLFGWRTRFWSFLLKLAKNRPSWTIQANPGPATGPFHWRSRRLSIQELCRLQTFPDGFTVEGEYRSRHRQIGNAVPPAIGEMFGREIRRQLLGERPYRRALFVPAARNDCPQPDSVKPVPKKYWDLRGDHNDHPGVGLGPRALRRVNRLKQRKDDYGQGSK
jgi:DNA (cytosine-5)-methyltransferase 1